jgi:hypothetical protein
MVLTRTGERAVSDKGTRAIRMVTDEGEARTLAGNGEAGFADGVGVAARFNQLNGLRQLPNGDLVVADMGNHAIRLVTMEGAVSTLVGNGTAGYADGAGAAARFNRPTDVAVDGEGEIVVADSNNNRLRKIVGEQATTVAGSSEGGSADGAGRDSLIRSGWLWTSGGGCGCGGRQGGQYPVVEASLAPPAWMGPVEQEAVAQQDEEKAALLALRADYGKLVEDPELADLVLVVEERRFPAHRNVLAARSEYFQGLLLSRMQEGGSREGRWAMEIELGEVSGRAFRVVLRYPYTDAGVWAGGGEGGGDGREG